MKTDMSGIGRRIKRAREKKGIRQESLAEAAGISPNHLSHIENAKSYPSLQVLVKIMDFLDMEPNEVFCESVGTAASYLRNETGRRLEELDMEDLIRISETVELAKLLKSRTEEPSR